jgi:hypothetical protein
VRLPFSLGIAGLTWLFVCTAPLDAQQGGEPDTANVHAHALRMVRDSAERVRGGLARFRRDLPMAGEQTVVSRAERLTRACEGLRTAFDDAVPLLRLSPGAHPGLVSAHRELLAAMRDTKPVLLRECEQGLSANGPGDWADSLKAWGPYRTSQIQRSLSSIDAGIARFARAADIKLQPDGH